MTKRRGRYRRVNVARLHDKILQASLVLILERSLGEPSATTSRIAATNRCSARVRVIGFTSCSYLRREFPVLLDVVARKIHHAAEHFGGGYARVCRCFCDAPVLVRRDSEIHFGRRAAAYVRFIHATYVYVQRQTCATIFARGCAPPTAAVLYCLEFLAFCTYRYF